MSAIAPTRRHGTPQSRQLAGLLDRSWHKVPAYRTLWQEAGLDRGTLLGLRSVADLECLPVIGKADLRRFAPAERCAMPLEAVAMERTSGSTGEPFDIPVDSASRRRRRLRFLRALVGAGYRPGQRLMMLTTHGSSWPARALGWHRVDINQGGEALLEAYRRIRPQVLYGPLNSLALLAQGLESEGKNLPRPRRVISTAEQLNPADRDRLRQGFGCEPGDFYGMSECGLLAWRAPGQRRYTVADRQFVLEFLPDRSEPSLERLVITDLAGGAMPLIRFQTGDLVARDRSLADKPVVAFRGREVDCLKRPDGGLVSPYRVTLALEDIQGLARYRIVQRADLSVEATLWREGVAATTLAETATQRLDALLNGVLSLRVEVAEEPPGAARKFRPVRCEAGGRHEDSHDQL